MPISLRFAACVGPNGAPPGTPPLSIVGDSVARLFEPAFACEAVQQGRPDATTWASSLEALEKSTKRSGAHPSHWYLKELQSCPGAEWRHKLGCLYFHGLSNRSERRSIWTLCGRKSRALAIIEDLRTASLGRNDNQHRTA
jgi:DNA-binding helix-hairpin-helix protein with protein kinase domain